MVYHAGKWYVHVASAFPLGVLRIDVFVQWLMEMRHISRELKYMIRYCMARIEVTLLDIVCTSICICFFSAWTAIIIKRLLFYTIIANALFCVVCLLYGSIIVKALKLRNECFKGFPFKFLTGFFLVSSFLFVFEIIIGLTIIPAFLWVSGILFAVTVFELAKKPINDQDVSGQGSMAALFCVVTSLVATTLWAQDSLKPIVFCGDSAVIKPWLDSFYHSLIIWELGLTDGTPPLEYSIVSGILPRIYHYASYMAPAYLYAVTGVSSFVIYNSFLVPVGFFLACMAAYVLVGSWWGEWPGFAAAACLLLFPDASYHGLANRWFSYHWLLMISPALSYGISLMGISWTLALEGIRGKRWLLLAISYLMTASCIIFKAHLFIAVCFVFAIYPIMFWQSIASKYRIALLVLITSLFIITIKISHYADFVPFISLDLSAASRYLTLVVAMIQKVYLRDLMQKVIGANRWLDIFMGAPFLYYATFGLFGLAYPALAFHFRSKIRKDVLFFPFFAIAMYLIMSLGFAYDKNQMGTPEELLHRPFVWAYFVVCSWVAGAIYMWKFGNHVPSGRLFRCILIVGLAGLLTVPYFLGHKLQIGPMWGNNFSWVRVPAGLVHACLFLRDSSGKRDVFQDSQGDPTVICTGLSERREFLINPMTRTRKPPQFSERKAKIEKLEAFASKKEITDFAVSCGIRWYILQPDDTVQWPKDVLDHPAFEEGGYRIFKLW